MRPLEGHTTKKKENNIPIGIRTADSAYTIRACDPTDHRHWNLHRIIHGSLSYYSWWQHDHRGQRNATLTGSFAGTRIAQGSEIIHPDGSFIASDTGTFTGTLDGALGTLVIAGHSTGVGGTGAGGFVVNDGTGALEDIHGYGPFQFTATGPTSTTGTYSVTIHA